MSHTPGPWEIRNRDHVGDNIFSVGGRRIANTFGDQSEGPYAANARLIAAAPDLLEQLEWITEKAVQAGWPRDLIEPCKTAIAKAKPEGNNEA